MNLLEFAEEVYSYKYKDKPDYAKLRFLLKKEILKLDKCPNDVFDWNKEIKMSKRRPKDVAKSSEDYELPTDVDEYKVLNKKKPEFGNFKRLQRMRPVVLRSLAKDTVPPQELMFSSNDLLNHPHSSDFVTD